jgi:hypothetical protein
MIGNDKTQGRVTKTSPGPCVFCVGNDQLLLTII